MLTNFSKCVNHVSIIIIALTILSIAQATVRITISMPDNVFKSMFATTNYSTLRIYIEGTK